MNEGPSHFDNFGGVKDSQYRLQQNTPKTHGNEHGYNGPPGYETYAQYLRGGPKPAFNYDTEPNFEELVNMDQSFLEEQRQNVQNKPNSHDNHHTEHDFEELVNMDQA